MTARVDGSITQKVYGTLDATRPSQPLSEAEWLDANHKVLVRLPEAVAGMTEPMMSPGVIAFYLLSERVSKAVKVALEWWLQVHVDGAPNNAASASV